MRIRTALQKPRKCRTKSDAGSKLHPNWTLTFITFAVLAPFLAKPFNIDDPLFIWVAKNIQAHPLNPYGFNVNWFGTVTPMWLATENPPVACYYIAFGGDFGLERGGAACRIFAAGNRGCFGNAPARTKILRPADARGTGGFVHAGLSDFEHDGDV
jgi:hypothetical protein